MNTTGQRYPRPKPRFAGLADVVLVAVDAVAKGWSEGEIGLLAGGVALLIVALVVAGLVAWLKIRRRRTSSNATNFSYGEAVEMDTMPSAIVPFAPTPPA